MALDEEHHDIWHRFCFSKTSFFAFIGVKIALNRTSPWSSDQDYVFRFGAGADRRFAAFINNRTLT
jgi:hypothetical protein